MTVITESNTLGDGIRWEHEGDYSRKKVTVLSGENLAILEVIGKQELSIPTDGAADAGNTGDGLCASVTGGQESIIEEITLECITAATDGGTFSVIGSKTGRLPDASVGVAYSSSFVNFTISDGATDFVVGDTFVIAIVAGGKKAVALDLTAVDGSQKAAGIMVNACDASSADKAGAACVRAALIDPDNLVWPSGITTDQKAQALSELADLGIYSVETA